MNAGDIRRLLSAGQFPDSCTRASLVETHISWVIVCDEFIYKIKKPVRFSFLDFSTPSLRAYFCRREIDLNRRLTHDLYLDVQPVCSEGDRLWIGNKERGTVIDYAVRMRRLDRTRHMDELLASGGVTAAHMKMLANQIAAFHRQAVVVKHRDALDVKEKFDALGEEISFLSQECGAWAGEVIREAISWSDSFLARNADFLRSRVEAGLFRDVHGDLHTGNIFLLEEPVIFDCIEFSDAYRQIDILNEVAFLCMDLEAHGRADLSQIFMEEYNRILPVIDTEQERNLFLYYKAYRADVLATVNSLKAKDGDEESSAKACEKAAKYLRLLGKYMAEAKKSAQ